MKERKDHVRFDQVAALRWTMPGVVEVRLQGCVDLATSGALGSALDDALAAAKRLLVLDLGAVVFMDSAAVGHIIRTIKRMPDGAYVALCSVPRHLYLILEIAGVLCRRPDGGGNRTEAAERNADAGAGCTVGPALEGKVVLAADSNAAMLWLQSGHSQGLWTSLSRGKVQVW